MRRASTRSLTRSNYPSSASLGSPLNRDSSTRPRRTHSLTQMYQDMAILFTPIFHLGGRPAADNLDLAPVESVARGFVTAWMPAPSVVRQGKELCTVCAPYVWALLCSCISRRAAETEWITCLPRLGSRVRCVRLRSSAPIFSQEYNSLRQIGVIFRRSDMTRAVLGVAGGRSSRGCDRSTPTDRNIT